jgi:hypothetical protein
MPGADEGMEMSADVTGQVEGGVFVVLSDDGNYWSGSEWVPEWRRAQHFAGPGDPYADCCAVAEELCAAGASCGLYYISRQRAAAKIEVA